MLVKWLVFDHYSPWHMLQIQVWLWWVSLNWQNYFHKLVDSTKRNHSLKSNLTEKEIEDKEGSRLLPQSWKHMFSKISMYAVAERITDPDQKWTLLSPYFWLHCILRLHYLTLTTREHPSSSPATCLNVTASLLGTKSDTNSTNSSHWSADWCLDGKC